MRRFLLVASLALCGAGLQCFDAHAQTSATTRAPAAQSQSSRAGGPAGAENCGTPDEFRPCPPMPRVPFKTFPGNR